MSSIGQQTTVVTVARVQRKAERTIKRGDTRAKLTPEEVELIRLLRKNGHTTTKIAGWFGISDAQVSRIARGQSWKRYER